MDLFIYFVILIVSLYSIVYSSLPFSNLFSNTDITNMVTDTTNNSDTINPYYDLNIQLAVQSILHDINDEEALSDDVNIHMRALLVYIQRLQHRLDDLYEMNQRLTYNERKLYEQKINIIEHSNIRGADLLHYNINQTKYLLFILSNITQHQSM